MKPKRYVTQLTAEDMRELAAATNLEAGWLVKIERNGDTVKIGIDEKALALAMNGFYRNGGIMTAAANCTTVSFNPPS